MLAMKRLHVTFLVVAMIAFCGITSASTVNMALTNVLITGFDGHSNFMSIMTIQPSGGPSLIGIDGLSSPAPLRSEERRVGKECRSRWSPYH